MKLNKAVLTLAMMVILIGLAYSLMEGFLLGSLVCLGATSGLFILTRHRGNT